MAGNKRNAGTHYVEFVRWNYRIIVLVAVVAAGIALAHGLLTEKTYRAEMTVLISRDGSGVEPTSSGSVGPLTQTVGALLQSTSVADAVIAELGLNMTSEELLDKLNVTSEPLSLVLDVTFDSTDSAQAVSILQTIGRSFPRILETDFGSGDAGNPKRASVTATIFDSPAAQLEPVAPHPLRDTIIAGILGMLIGLMVALVREALAGELFGDSA